MKIIIRTVVVFIMMTLGSWGFAEQLEIHVDSKPIQLPYWPSLKKNTHGALLFVYSGETQASSLLEFLAKQLAFRGWSVVLLQQNESLSKVWQEVLVSLRKQQLKRVVALHYGEQLYQTLALLNTPNKKPVEGFIFLSAYDGGKVPFPKIKLELPVFDLLGQFDYEPVKTQAEQRLRLFSQNRYLVKQIPGASHDYTHSKDLLLSFMQGWMLLLPEFKPASPPAVLISYLEPVSFLFIEQVAWD